MKKQENTETTERKYNYSKDKRAWVHYADGRGKDKLRKYISNIAKEIAKDKNAPYETVREYIIKPYNEGGLKAIKLWIEKMYEEKPSKQEND